ncbi:TonB-dependent receptor [Ferruginibacter albus]|uniref:hypothetical protein n=1 Tax=Ferruginibacter albus TaxID=2875540 RepID=UPI001CC79ABE|nr:hypothetical protein [Ferruginibacter albus]UAY51114.1 hypothetical protein K9M53_10985 [Ferruginibacter albus]
MKRLTLYLFSVLCTVSTINAVAQDTTRKQVIEITSSYKPVLRNAVKINFQASNLSADTSKVRLQYNIPAQNLFYTYQPLPLKPLALQTDTIMELGTRNFIKVGFGNYSTPYARAGFSLGDGKTSLVNIYADYISSKGNIANQDYSQFNVKAAGSYFTANNEFYGKAAINQSNYYLYGYDHSIDTFSKDEVKQRYSTLILNAGLRNKDVNAAGINYNPNIQFSFVSNADKVTENTVVVKAPVDKTINDKFTVKVALNADATTYDTKNLPANVSIHNNVFQLAPAVVYDAQKFTVQAGVTPTWDNSQLNVLPDINVEFPVKDKIFLVQAGWVGEIIKNTYQYLSGVNPYLQTPLSQTNTRETEFYGGIKATVGNHFNFNAKIGLVTYHNLPLFVNDSIIGNSFYIRNESKADNLRIHVDFSYINKERFTFNGGLTINGFTGLTDNTKAWHQSPIEVESSVRWWADKKILLKADLYAFGGAPYLLPGNINKSLSGGADLGAGVEYSITKQWSGWLDINNLLNNKYERWHNYPVYGLNFLIGAKYSF